jgi:hypothetical protein
LPGNPDMKGKADKLNIREIIVAAIVSYIISFLIDLILGIRWREITLGNTELYIDRPGGGWNLLIHYLILTGIMVLLFYAAASGIRKEKKKIKKIGIGVLGTLLIAGSVLLFLTKAVPIAGVDNVMEIKGSVNDLEAHAYLFVRPIGSTQCWLQNPVPLQTDNHGEWRAVVYFGGVSGSKYELFLITSKKKLERFPKAGSYDCNEISDHLKRFVRIVRLK